MSNVIYDIGGTKVTENIVGHYIVESIDGVIRSYARRSILLTLEEIDAIHAAIHADDEPEAEPVECCENCRFARKWWPPQETGQQWGKCHRECPSGHYDNERWGNIELSDWCGEHRRKE